MRTLSVALYFFAGAGAALAAVLIWAVPLMALSAW